MIHWVEGNLLESRAEALVNTVNTVGVMGKGIALQFKSQFPNNFKAYAKACKEGIIRTGRLFVTSEESLLAGKRVIINFPTKTDWRKPSEYSYIEEGLQELVKFIKENSIRSIAIPPLGAGNGGLNWNQVMVLMEKYLQNLDAEVYIYRPNYVVQEALKKERVKLTPARAMLLAVLFELVRNGEFVSEFAAEKIAYFLQRFGGKDVFKLEFERSTYGPYSGKVKHVLYYLNGSYITGYSAKDKKPFEEIGLMMDAEPQIVEYLSIPENEKYKQIADKTKVFLTGFYSSFGLELLSTVDFIAQKESTVTANDISLHIEKWSDRKKVLFSKQKYVDLAIQHLIKNLLHA